MDLLSVLVFLQQWVGEQFNCYPNKHFFFVSVPVLLFTVFFLFKILGVWSSSTETHIYNLPPSPPRFPIIGNLHQLGTLAHRSLRDLSQKYGPLMFLHLGQSPTLVVSSVEMAKEIMKNQDLVFANRPALTAGKALAYGCTDIGLAPYGEYWRQVKKIAVVELLSVKRVQSYKHVRVEEVGIVIEKISRLCSSREDGAQVLSLTEILLTLTNNVVSRCALGVRYETAHGNRFPKMSSNFLGLFNAFSFGDFFPSIGWMDVVTGLSNKFEKAFQEVDTFLDQVIDDHLLRHSKPEVDHGQVEDSDELDLTDILILSQENYKNLSRNNIKAILMDMFIGGSDTSARTMEWAMAELIKNPKVMKKAQDEVRRVVGKKSTVEEDDINQMAYLKCIVKEILRLHPSLPNLIPRATTKGTQIAGYDIPPNTSVFINAWAIQRDPNIWEDAEEFRPERFINNPIDFKGQDFQFIPFGSGRRGCPGISFAITVVEFALASLLYHFNWELPYGEKIEELDMTENFGLSVSKRTPLCVLPTIYSSRQLYRRSKVFKHTPTSVPKKTLSQMKTQAFN
ncbi:cytochrome P450 71A1-like [Papaver somniferum]|uniref:cytochrome P450 71A1-like n=1 Tax=Papaver somniferum TaxID=3469 RepID=UPI000E6FE8D4|nr:cytochrome P450 71A1-like [Papaver somniferum]